MDDFPPLESMNTTELIEIYRRRTGKIIKRSMPREQLVSLLEEEWQPSPEMLSGTMKTRRTLQLFNEKNWLWIQSQLPCKGENKGHCTVYPCTEARHVDCWLSAYEHVAVEFKVSE